MDTDDKEKRKAIIDRLIKLQGLADTTANSFQNEVSVATAKIAEIMNKYAISWAELQAAKQTQDDRQYEQEFKDKESDHVFRNVKAWHWKLAQIVGNATNTKPFRSGSRMVFYGLESSGEYACEIFTEFLGMLDRISLKAQREYVKEHGRGSVESRYFRSSWLAGCLTQMSNNVYAEKQKARQANNTALVLFENAIEKAYKDRSRGFVNTRGRGISIYSNSGYESGKAFGSGIHVGSKKLTGTRLLTG